MTTEPQTMTLDDEYAFLEGIIDDYGRILPWLSFQRQLWWVLYRICPWFQGAYLNAVEEFARAEYEHDDAVWEHSKLPWPRTPIPREADAVGESDVPSTETPAAAEPVPERAAALTHALDRHVGRLFWLGAKRRVLSILALPARWCVAAHDNAFDEFATTRFEYGILVSKQRALLHTTSPSRNQTEGALP